MSQQPTDRLIDALLAISSDLHLRQTLQQIVEAAREVAGATYAALGVLGEGGSHARLAEFLTAGMSAEEIAHIDHAPEGHGLLGALIDDPRGLRIKEISEHPNSFGFPSGHPQMHSFLGVPIRVRDEVFGNLYLTDKIGGGEFTADDEQLLTVLATAAGLAINNARLYEAARHREKRLNAQAEITTAVLSSADADEVISIVADRARELVDADFVLIFLPQPDGQLVAEIGSGHTEGRMHLVARHNGIVTRVAATSETFVTTDLINDPRTGATAFTGVGPAVVVPLAAGGRSHGVLFIGNNSGRHAFSPADISAAESLAAQAAFALILSENQADRGKLLVLEERDRIARDLHDLVIQRIFATGLMLQGVARQGVTDEAKERIAVAMEQLDETIREVRSTITDLHDPSAMRTSNLASRLQLEVNAAVTLLGFAPTFEMEGDLTTLESIDVIEQLVAITREALTNAAKHANANHVLVEVVATDDQVSIRVVDDGVGIPVDVTRRSGVKNIEMRAKRMKGTCHMGVRRDGLPGTEIYVSVPIR